MSHRLIFRGLSGFLLLWPIAALAQSTQSAPIDPSSPKGALKALALAMDHGDADAIHRLVEAKTPSQAKMVDLMSEMAVAIADLKTAMRAQFGAEQAQSVLDPTDELKQSLANIDAASENDKGDTATVSITATPDGTKSMKRVDGMWKLSVEKSVDQLSSQQLDEDVAMLQSQIHGMQEVAREVRAGKYATAADAAAALHTRMGATATTPPAASQPAH